MEREDFIGSQVLNVSLLMKLVQLRSEFREGLALSLLVLEILQALGEEWVLHLEAFLDDVDHPVVAEHGRVGADLGADELLEVSSRHE